MERKRLLNISQAFAAIQWLYNINTFSGFKIYYVELPQKVIIIIIIIVIIIIIYFVIIIIIIIIIIASTYSILPNRPS